jgi:hypothetical protein
MKAVNIKYFIIKAELHIHHVSQCKEIKVGETSEGSIHTLQDAVYHELISCFGDGPMRTMGKCFNMKARTVQ